MLFINIGRIKPEYALYFCLSVLEQVQSIPDLAPPPVTDTRQQQPPSGPSGPPPNLPHPGRGGPFGDISHLFGGNGFIPPTNLQRHIPAVPIPGMPQQNGTSGTVGDIILIVVVMMITLVVMVMVVILMVVVIVVVVVVWW